MSYQRVKRILSVVFCLVASAGYLLAHPLGNFTINHFSRIEVGDRQIKLRYVIDMAEIPTFQEVQTIDTNGDQTASEAELKIYAERMAPVYVQGLAVTIDGKQVPLKVVSQNVFIQNVGQNGGTGLETLRIECELLAKSTSASSVRRLRFEDNVYSERIGWREIVATAIDGIAIFDSSVYGNAITAELKNYPNDKSTAPLDERTADLSFIAGPVPVGSRALMTRDGRIANYTSRDRLAELIAIPQLTVSSVFLGLLVAMFLGAMHALSPGHGKTVVGAYLVGTRGTARHAVFLGLTVTITHTAGVFALGVVTLLASEYVLPERLFPVLSLVSGAIVVAIGLSLLVRRLSAAFGIGEHSHRHSDDPTQPHSHGGRVHSHVPPGSDGSPVTWRSLLALGISGGLLPCPSALVVLLAAISLHRVGYGLLLVVAFSLGLAGTLTAVGLAFVYAGRFLKATGKFDRLSRVLPVFSSFVISCLGLVICYEALNLDGLNIFQKLASLAHATTFVSASAFGILGLGLVYGLKHATEADHIIAVSTIVSEHRRLVRAALVGALWGLGHTVSLVIVGVIVLALKVAITETLAGWLEFAVAIMIIVLGLMALRRALRCRYSSVHTHRHEHSLLAHSHLHLHESEVGQQANSSSHSHGVLRLGLKPAIVGAVHGLAGSAALTLLVLTQIASPLLGFFYLVTFGIGSILGMLFVSGLIGLPFVLGSGSMGRVQYQLQLLAGILSIVFGIWYGYETGIVNGIARAMVSSIT
jgi:ABC-type nickel/cobalt efflux system permease component RcnA